MSSTTTTHPSTLSPAELELQAEIRRADPLAALWRFLHRMFGAATERADHGTLFELRICGRMWRAERDLRADATTQALRVITEVQALQRLVREAHADGHVSPAEVDKIEQAMACAWRDAEKVVRIVRLAPCIEHAEPLPKEAAPASPLD